MGAGFGPWGPGLAAADFFYLLRAAGQDMAKYVEWAVLLNNVHGCMHSACMHVCAFNYVMITC